MLLWLTANPVHGQDADCRVVFPPLTGTYEGECRGGLAHGFGNAWGEDHYEGHFKNGLPHGQGTYTWTDGKRYEGRWRRGRMHGIGRLTEIRGSDTVQVEAVWKRGVMLSDRTEASGGFVVTRSRGVESVRALKMAAGSTVVIKITRFGMPLNYFDLGYTGSSGTARLDKQEIRFENVDFPFTAQLRYRVPNVMKTGSWPCDVAITITEPGLWTVTTQQ